MNWNRNPVVEGKGPREERRGHSITPLGRSYQGEGERGVVDPTMNSLVLRFQSLEVEGRWFVVTTVTIFFIFFIFFLFFVFF